MHSHIIGERREHLGPDYAQFPYLRPDLDIADKLRMSYMFDGGDAPLWSTDVSGLSRLGLGASAYFHMLRQLSFLFLAISVLYLPALVCNLSGNALQVRSRCLAGRRCVCRW